MKKEYIILVLVIIGLVAYLSLRSTNQTHYELPRLETLEKADIDRLRVTPIDGDPIELVKRDDQWFIEPQGYKADAVKVKNMVSSAAGLTITTLVSESANYERYDLTDDKKMNVQLFMDEKKVREFDLGRVAPTFQHTFARLEGNPNIYYAKGAMKNTFDQTIQTLRDKTVLSFEKNTINTMEIQKGKLSLKIAKKEIPPASPAADEDKENPGQESDNAIASTAPPKTQWQDTQDQPVDQTAVDTLLGSLADLKCEAYLDDEAHGKLGDPDWVVTVSDASTPHRLSVYFTPSQEENDSNDRVPATSSDSQYAFEFPKYKLEDMEKHLNTLLGVEDKAE